MEFFSIQTYRLLSGISSNEESGYLALLENEKKGSLNHNEILKWLMNCQLRNNWKVVFRLSCAFKECDLQIIIQRKHKLYTSWIFPSTTAIPTTPYVLGPATGEGY